MPPDRNVEVTYTWVQYLDDEKQDLYTIRKRTTKDYIKVLSKAEAIRYCDMRNKR